MEVPIEAQPGDRDATPTLPDPLWSVLKAKFPALEDSMVRWVASMTSGTIRTLRALSMGEVLPQAGLAQTTKRWGALEPQRALAFCLAH